MPRKTKASKLPYLSLTVASEGVMLVNVQVTKPVPHTARYMDGQMRVANGTDRLAVAITLIETAIALAGIDPVLKEMLEDATMYITGLHLRGIRMIEKHEDQIPF